MTKFAQLGPDFDDFVRTSSTGLLRIAVLLTSDRGHAEDLLQTSLVRTAAHWSIAKHNPTSYARRVLVNLAKNRWRDLSRRPREAHDLQGVDLVEHSGDESVLQREAMVALVAELPMGHRKILILRYFEDLSVAETALILGCSEGTVKSGTSRALSKLRELLAAQAVKDTEERTHVQR